MGVSWENSGTGARGLTGRSCMARQRWRLEQKDGLTIWLWDFYQHFFFFWFLLLIPQNMLGGMT